MAGEVEVLQEVGFGAMIPLTACAEPDDSAAGDCCREHARADREGVYAAAPVGGNERGDVGVVREDVRGGGGGCGVVGGAEWLRQERGAEEQDWGGGRKHCLFGCGGEEDGRYGDGLVVGWAAGVVYMSSHPFEGRVTVSSSWTVGGEWDGTNGCERRQGNYDIRLPVCGVPRGREQRKRVGADARSILFF